MWSTLGEAAANRAAGLPLGGLGAAGLGSATLGLKPSPQAPAASLNGLAGADSSIYNLGALPDKPTLPGQPGPTKPRQAGLGRYKPRAGLYGL